MHRPPHLLHLPLLYLTCEAIALSTNHTPYQAQIGNPGGVVRYNHWIIRGGFGVSRECGVQ
jgi:hypothetical protein